MEPLPTGNKAYSMVTTVERKMDVQTIMSCESNFLAMFVKTQGSNKDTGVYEKRDTKKSDKKCSHCGNNGHLKESYFKIIE